MSINVEFCPYLALRDYSEFEKGSRKQDECIPKKLEPGKVYSFLKSGHRLYWFNDDEFWSRGEMPLAKTEGNEKLSRPLAGIRMLEVTHFLENGKKFTKGRYKVIEVFDPKDTKIHFEGLKRIK